MRKAVISANGALTLQVARSLKRIGLHWGSDIGLLGFDELEWAELAGWASPPSNSRPGKSAMPL
jgi:LacI family kdg operon repressor